MGAHGGYQYFKKDDMRLYVKDADIDIFVKFIGHSFFQSQQEDLVDVRKWEREKFGDMEVIRLPCGSYVSPKLDFVSLGFNAFANTEAEVNAFKAWMFDRGEILYHRGSWWWLEPRSWYVWDGLSRKFILPVGAEIGALERVEAWMRQIGGAKFDDYLTTWT